MLMGMTQPRLSEYRSDASCAAESSLANGTNTSEKWAMFDLWHIKWVLKRWMLAAVGLWWIVALRSRASDRVIGRLFMEWVVV